MSYYKYSTHSISKVDNRKFNMEPLSSQTVYIAQNEDDKKQNMELSYGLPLQDDLYSVRYNSFLIGNRDMDVNAKPYSEIEIPVEKKDKKETKEEFCDLDDNGVSVCGKDKKLDKILDPRFNLKEVAKNSILLEDHLFQITRQCNDCIKKHCLMIEGFLEEAITLDKNKEYTQELDGYLSHFKGIFIELATKLNKGDLTVNECREFAQKLRQFRKPICQKYATFF